MSKATRRKATGWGVMILALTALAPLAGCDSAPPMGAVGRPDRIAPQEERVAVARGRIDVDGGLIQVAAQRDGVIVEVCVTEGAEVVAGQLLARQDSRVARTAVAEAQAALAEAQMRLLGNHVRMQSAALGFDRLSTLQPGAVPAREVDTARSLLYETRAETRSQMAAIDLARARLESAKVELSQREIRAPSAGRIARSMARPGSGASTLNVSTLFTLIPDRPYIVRVDVEEAFVDRLAVGQPVRIETDAAPGTALAGVVQRIGQVFGQQRIDPTDAQQKLDEQVVEVIVSLPDRSLRIGQRVLVSFLRTSSGPAAPPPGRARSFL